MSSNPDATQPSRLGLLAGEADEDAGQHQAAKMIITQIMILGQDTTSLRRARRPRHSRLDREAQRWHMADRTASARRQP